VYYDNHAAIAYYFIKGVSVKLADLPPPKVLLTLMLAFYSLRPPNACAGRHIARSRAASTLCAQRQTTELHSVLRGHAGISGRVLQVLDLVPQLGLSRAVRSGYV
jgi:hypothetical protein